MRRALTFCFSLLLLSSDQVFFIIEKIRSIGADVPKKQNTNLTSFLKVWNGYIFVRESLAQLGPLFLIEYQCICHLSFLSLSDL